jgi:oligoendopeptidase F
MQTQGVTWDLSSYFPAFNGPEMQQFRTKLEADANALLDKLSAIGGLDQNTIGDWAAAIMAIEDLLVRRGHISSYLNNLSSADAANEEYPQAIGSLGPIGATLDKCVVELQRGLKGCSDSDFDALLARPEAQGAEYNLRRHRELAKKTMSPAEERLAADLGVDGLHAWSRLYDKITGKLEFEMPWPDGRVEKLPISRWRSLMGDPDRAIGRAAFEAGNRTWETVADVCASALNAMSGWRLTLTKRRGYDHYLDTALFQSGISQATLDAMYKALHKNLEIPREIYRTKARHSGRSGVWFFEREAPLKLPGGQSFTWDEGSEMVSDAFRSAYPGLADYYSEFLAQRWMESESRGGKRPGAYCTGSSLTREQRVFMTYNGTLSDITTLAHEMGHAWHSHLLIGMRPVARQYPMTLAETASIFAEHILAAGVHGNPEISDAEKLLMLDEEMSSAAVIILDITTRFEFEKAMHDERAKGELTVSQFKELMVASQRRVWGDALEAGGEDPLFWASKLHFYISYSFFYNYPYTFGWLLARTLANKLAAQGSSFLPKYEDFLRLTGSDTVENVVKRSIGEDTTDPAFWEGAVLSLEPQILRYKELLAAVK